MQEKPVLRDFGSSLKRLKWDPAKQAAVEVSSQDGKRRSDTNEDVVRIETRLVVCDVLVLDQQGRAVPGLSQSDFIVTEDTMPQQITHFSLGDDINVERSIVLIFDYSISQRPFLPTSLAGANHLVDQLGPNDRMAIVTDDVKLLVDFTRNKTQLKEALESLRKRVILGKTGGSCQFSALMASVRELFSNEDIRPIIVFQTDGDELQFLQPPGAAISKLPEWRYNIKEYSLDDIKAAAEKSRVTVYTIVPGLRLLGFTQSEQLNRAEIIYERWTASPRPLREPFLTKFAESVRRFQAAAAEMAEVTGGTTAFLEDSGQAWETYSRILSDLDRRYVIGYYPANKTRDGKRRKVLIEVRNHPEYIVQGRKSYRTPAPEQ